eukprot:CAMPEP_0179984670 /NCGR_PEP_ID=MMETSP0984-20121128/1262_1 /TAXON_ID=483367 /ORGANISM="non described non described, Strain CCMP 2436" /LENGTH=104 /DNA_ID=CAMNT_0021903283 /DNA_START=79 /DNA_END=394 /DNA_ORIENTATION=-
MFTSAHLLKRRVAGRATPPRARTRCAVAAAGSAAGLADVGPARLALCHRRATERRRPAQRKQRAGGRRRHGWWAADIRAAERERGASRLLAARAGSAVERRTPA